MGIVMRITTRTFTWVLLVIYCTSLFCAITLAEEGLRTIILEKAHLSISFPSVWQVEEPAIAGSLVLLTSPDESPSDPVNENCNLIQVPEGPSITLETLFARPRHHLRERLVAFEDLGQKFVNVSGGRAIRGMHSHTMQGTRLQVVQYKFFPRFVERSQSGFILSCTSLQNNFQAWEKIFDKVFQSIRFQAPP
jgi:hypothetical protein